MVSPASTAHASRLNATLLYSRRHRDSRGWKGSLGARLDPLRFNQFQEIEPEISRVHAGKLVMDGMDDEVVYWKDVYEEMTTASSVV